MQKIGILGGTFNPVHKEHISIGENAIRELSLDKLIVMPTFMSPHKTAIPASAQDRVNMLKLAFSEMEKAEVSTYEIDKEGKSFTYITVEYFKSLHPDAELYFIVGGDMLVDFKTWKNPERILSACNLAVFDREDFSVDYNAEREYFKNTFGKTFIKLNYNGKSSSSTKIRVYNSLKIPIPFALSCVEKYIKDNGLYSGDKYAEFIINNLKESRVIHTANVICTALSKAKELSLDYQKVLLSAMLHDCAKYLNAGDYKDFKLPSGVPKPVEHAFLGAYIAEKVLGITDSEVIDAIRYHTSGKANMSTLSKLIFVADMVEEGRNYEGVEKLRALYKKDFDACFIECLKEEFIHLKNKGQPIYEETVNAYKYYVK